MANVKDDDFSFGDFNFASTPNFVTSTRVDPSPIKAHKPNGSLPLSLFDEINEDEIKSDSNLNGLFYHKNNDDLVKSQSIYNKNDEDDEWDFMAAFSANLDHPNLKGNVVVNGSNVEHVDITNQEKQAGQHASNSVNLNNSSISYGNGNGNGNTDFFAAPYGNGNVANNQSSETDFGFKSSPNTTNGFAWDPFPNVENMSNGNGISASSLNEDDDFDEFGDFVDASQVVSKDQEPVVSQMNLAEPQLPNGEVQGKQTQSGHTRGAIPLSFFGDDTEESSDSLNIQNEVVDLPTFSSGNSFGRQGSATSIQDLISNLYSQAQQTSTNTVEKPADSRVQFHSNIAVTTLDEDEDWDDDSWEFKGALSQNVVGGQLSTASLENMALKVSEVSTDLQSYSEFYDQLKDTLCFLLSCQLDERKNAQFSDAVTCNGEKPKSIDDEIQEAFKLLEESEISKEVLSKEFDRYHCLNKFIEVLQGPRLNMIESDFSLLKRLQLATNDWRVAAELLRHAISMQKVLSLGSADEQSQYASTWSKILNVAIQELRCGSLIWRRALEKSVQHYILSDSRGQQYFQALGEIYKVVTLIGLSAKVYKPWILRNVCESSQIFAGLEECDALWSNSGLKEAVQNLSAVTFGCSETTKTAIDSIKNIRDIDIFTMHDRVSTQHKSFCQFSLLPLEMVTDLKTVMWGEEAYFLIIANLWANLISCSPPQLPHLEVK